MNQSFEDTVKMYLRDSNHDYMAQMERLTLATRMNQNLETSKLELIALNKYGTDVIDIVKTQMTESGFLFVETMCYVDRHFYLALDQRKGCVDAFISVKISPTDIIMELLGAKLILDHVETWFTTAFTETGIRVDLANKYDTLHDYITYSREALYIRDTDLAKPSFYPWLTVPLEQYFDAYCQADEPVLVLIGPPGQGKSTFLRTFLSYTKLKAVLAHNQDVVSQPALFQDFYSRNNEVLICEDIGDHLRGREDGNSLMSTILNETNGIIPRKNKKVIFSTNLPSIDRIDPALLRVGRCYDILHFRNLTPNEASVIRLDMGMEPRDFTEKDNWTLTEALARNIEGRQMVNRFAKRAGF